MSADVVPIQPNDPISDDLPQGFDAFWALYPRHVAKKDARRAWERLTDSDRTAALVALVSWRRVWLARGELEYVMHPSTYLNGERWTDELPPTMMMSSAHVPVNGRKYERGEMPAEVRAALRKLLGKP